MNVRTPNRLPHTGRRLAGQVFGAFLLAVCACASGAQPGAPQHHAPIQRVAPPPVRSNLPAQQGRPQEFRGGYGYGQRSYGRQGSYSSPTPSMQQPSMQPEGRQQQMYPGSTGGETTRGFSGQNSGGAPSGDPRAQQNQPRNGNQGGQFINPNRPGQSQQHLGSWMESHRNLPLDQQHRALEQEPGFHQLAPEQQQRMRDRLTDLNRMDPAKRQGMIDRTEAMERLNPQQRQQVRSAAAQLGGLPPDRQRVVAQTFRGLQSMPPDQRQNYMNSPQFRSQFNDQERGTLNNLMQVSPYLPMRQAAPPQ